MAFTKEGLLVPDHAVAPLDDKLTKEWTLSEVRAFEKTAKAMINHGLSFMVMCSACGVAGRNAMCSALGTGEQGVIHIECDCTVHVLKGPRAKR